MKKIISLLLMMFWFICYPTRTFALEVFAGQIKWSSEYWDEYWKICSKYWR